MEQQNEQDGPAETGRDRVRRLLLAPMGFRHPKGVDEAEGRKRLDNLADELGYMTDASLAALAEMVQFHGQGSARNWWPDRATFIGLAEVVQPRPIAALPALRSWFGSVEGPRAQAAGELVETYEYIARRKLPPATSQARQLVAEQARENARRLLILGERRAAGLGVMEGDVKWERWYLARRAECEAIVKAERAARGHGDLGGEAA